MGKRVSNKRGKHAGARCRGIRIGYWKQQGIESLRTQRKKALEEMRAAKSKDERLALSEAIAYMGKQIRSLVPKALLRRHQGR